MIPWYTKLQLRGVTCFPFKVLVPMFDRQHRLTDCIVLREVGNYCSVNGGGGVNVFFRKQVMGTSGGKILISNGR